MFAWLERRKHRFDFSTFPVPACCSLRIDSSRGENDEWVFSPTRREGGSSYEDLHLDVLCTEQVARSVKNLLLVGRQADGKPFERAQRTLRYQTEPLIPEPLTAKWILPLKPSACVDS